MSLVPLYREIGTALLKGREGLDHQYLEHLWLEGRPCTLHYGASKAALEYLTRSWALELAPIRIRVNAVAVGPTETGALENMMGLSRPQAEVVKQAEREQIPLGRRGTPDDISRWIVLLADPSSDWITGQVLAVDGGLSLV